MSYLGNLAAEDVPKSGEGVVHGFVVNGLVQVFDEDVANSGSAKAGIALAPHDSDRFAFQNVKVHRVQSSLG